MNIPAFKIEAFVAKEEDSPVMMKGIWFDAESSRLLATDGHMAARISVTIRDGDFSGLLPIEVFELARKEIKAIIKINGKEQLPDPWLCVTCHEENIEIENLLTNTKHFVLRPKKVEGVNFPNVDKAFPSSLGEPTISLSRALLKTAVENTDGSSDATFWISGREKVAVIASTIGGAIVAVMPMRGDAIADEVVKRGSNKTSLNISARTSA